MLPVRAWPMSLMCTLGIITSPHGRSMPALVQALLQKAGNATCTNAGPHMSVAGGHLERGFREVRRHTHGLTSNPTVGPRSNTDS